MGKKLFIIMIILMSLSLIGIIFVQSYYINNSVQNEEERFTYDVKKALIDVSRTIEKREFTDHIYKFERSIEQGVPIDTSNIESLYLVQDDRDSNETLIYRNGILEENYKLSSSLFDIGLDSINITRILNERETKVYANSDIERASGFGPKSGFKLSNESFSREVFWESSYKDIAYRTPIHKRVSKKEIELLLDNKLRETDIDIDYEYAIYSNDLATKIFSEGFEFQKSSNFAVPIFSNVNDRNNYQLWINFPEHKKFVLSSLIGMILLSIIFTSIIILAYSSAIFQLMKQRKISQIKTDFINNMTHEFKTPIATINLALDSIKNPKVIDDKEKVIRYLNMIKEENKRMHAQVENVLRISKLEKNELNISKVNVELHDLIEDAITHVQLIVEDRQGSIETSFEAIGSSILANETHFTNVIVNILDNAIKYSPEAPKINIITENIGNNILLKIQDHGSGMNKTVQKRVFEKFYREHTGNVHNVKGHGLGLSYVKRIIDDHHGHISVESEKGKGSTFIIKLPLIS